MVVDRVVFLQGDEASEALKLFEDKGAEGVLQYLCEWHYPGEHETAKGHGCGTSDDVYIIGDYILAVNTALSYISLEYVSDRDGWDGSVTQDNRA